LGPESVIAELKPQQMRDFHTNWYQPQSITAVAVGNLPVEELIATVAEGFTKATKTPHSPLPLIPTPHSLLIPESPFTEIVRREFIDESLQQARLVMVWRVPGMTELDRTYGLDVLAGILGHGRTSRLVRDLREEQGLVTSISVSNMSNQLQGTFYISAKCAVDNLSVVENAIAQHIGKLQTELVTELEIDRVRRRVANRYVFGNETPSDRSGLYGYYQSLVGDLEPAFNYPAMIQSQNATDLMQAAKDYLSPNAYGVVFIKP
jgi:zinc protease